MRKHIATPKPIHLILSTFALALVVGCGPQPNIDETEELDEFAQIEEETPAIEEETPIIEEETPIIEEELPPTEELPPEEPPVVEEPPPVEEIAPAVAPFDNDSLFDPAAEYFLRITGTRSFTLDQAISYPAGDEKDFVQFELPNNSNPTQYVWVTLNCDIDGQANAIIRATLWEDGIRTTRSVACNEGEQRLTVDNTKVQTLEIHFASVAEPTYADYTLEVLGFR